MRSEPIETLNKIGQMRFKDLKILTKYDIFLSDVSIHVAQSVLSFF